MKKKDVLDLIRYHFENDSTAFKNQSLEIAREFSNSGEEQLSSYIMGLISQADTFIPQESNLNEFFQIVPIDAKSLPLPTPILDDVKGIINAVNHNVGIHKFLFVGSPGTGKTESVKQVARLLNRELLMVNFSSLMDSKLGQSAKNLISLFDVINQIPNPNNFVILFDEIDALVLDRINSNDIREMGRLTSEFLKLLDRLSTNIILIGTTNLYENIDKALSRRFDAIVPFDRYTSEDLVEIAEVFLNQYLKQFKTAKRDIKLFKKILTTVKKLPYPADLKNIIRTSLAFSNENDQYDYLKRLVKSFHNGRIPSIKQLNKLGFTVREIEIITGVSKSSVSRELSEESKHE
ncbi:ATP-binding protein [Leuconostoc mesenteroides]|uniref:ATPase of the AAA+ class n=1 Tax=Leuconostoc mesenteroides subsp. mesenteroides (strain ATCC 8293 / DSM 20343 / BCRC 11652 / CCM 1803 / JCM 6124 / NCDO 523 / NBRC 100496 / NCIMB 8023 / NCTC 12954 / NRRL B-1118 / 37Y) TaxID=203120 RepID=Q03WS2_LEUMM|nr:ATP-binding protein [Leuconostoc mesenteroides]ABJ62350.1 ATPase of the AAA+ class [Leuconostoc mesenteroides subsp. mesenteroides ATCC 8293]MCT3042717.1 AAA family ATPase [Leuconostoc mesenteroides]MCT3045408.1 AAA family ATPase [Leuconostoc mesenteroides]MDG9747237.1 ATP-binding protein [Leuconostoc mesenteroides]QQB30864.1 AAA family ATPase [Leuconostoc mesenteroides]